MGLFSFDIIHCTLTNLQPLQHIFLVHTLDIYCFCKHHTRVSIVFLCPLELHLPLVQMTDEADSPVACRNSCFLNQLVPIRTENELHTHSNFFSLKVIPRHAYGIKYLVFIEGIFYSSEIISLLLYLCFWAYLPNKLHLYKSRS